VQEIVLALDRGDVESAKGALKELTRWSQLGKHLTTPWKAAVLGAPNVGKSSLVNALAGFQRSIVSPMPGTTRDVVSTLIAVDGWPVELFDTAGLREAGEDLEAEGVRRARAAAAAADLRLWVLDGSTTPVWPDKNLGSMIVVINKIDVPAAWDWSGLESQPTRQVSAQTGEGLRELCEAIARALVPENPPAGAAVPFTAEQCDKVEAALRLLEADHAREARQTLAALTLPG
jgi:tRNA modification GTPase